MEQRFERVGIKLPLKKSDIKDAQNNFDDWSSSLTENANKMSPLYILNEQTKVGSSIARVCLWVSKSSSSCFLHGLCHQLLMNAFPVSSSADSDQVPAQIKRQAVCQHRL